VLDEWLAEKDESLFVAVLKVDLEVVLLEGGSKLAEPVHELRDQVAIVGHPRRLNDHEESELIAFLIKKFLWYVQNDAKLIALLGLVYIILFVNFKMQSQLVHDMHLDELTEFPDERLPQGIDLDGLLVGNCVRPLLAVFVRSVG